MTSLYFFLYYGLDTESVLCVYVEHYTHLLGAYISPICRSRVGWEVKWGKEEGGWHFVWQVLT